MMQGRLREETSVHDLPTSGKYIFWPDQPHSAVSVLCESQLRRIDCLLTVYVSKENPVSRGFYLDLVADFSLK